MTFSLSYLVWKAEAASGEVEVEEEAAMGEKGRQSKVAIPTVEDTRRTDTVESDLKRDHQLKPSDCLLITQQTSQMKSQMNITVHHGKKRMNVNSA